MIASYMTDTGACRVVQLRSHAGELLDAVGCLDGEAWRTVAVLPQSADDAYLPAEDAAADALGALLDSLGAAGPMEAPEERRLIDRAWRHDGQSASSPR